MKIAMTADKDKQRVGRFRPRLEQMLDELLALRDSSAQDLAAVQLDQQSVGRLSRMDAIQRQQMAFAADLRRQVQISRIRRALKTGRSRRVRLLHQMRR